MRSVGEWVASHDDQFVPHRVRLRILERQGGKCAISGLTFRPGDRVEFDHVRPLWLWGPGENGHREDNLQAVLGDKHKEKTRVEAGQRQKVFNLKKKHLGLREKKPWNTKLRRKMSGEVVRIEDE